MSSRRSRRAPSTAQDDGASTSTRSRRHRNRDSTSHRNRDSSQHTSSQQTSSHLHPNQHNPSHRPPSVVSRYSLRDQFAATRQEYEFGFDDASSILERSTFASEAVHGDEAEGVPGAARLAFSSGRVINRDCYELLCLPRSPSLSPDQIWEAAHRLAQVLAVDKQPPALQGSAAFQLGLAQAAVETLVDPSRRLGYDISRAGKTDLDSDEEGIYDEFLDLEGSGAYEARLQEQYLLLTQRESRAGTDVGLRLDATSLVGFVGSRLGPRRDVDSQRGTWRFVGSQPQRGSRRQGLKPEILDFSLQKTASTSVPALRKPIERTIGRAVESTVLFIRNLGAEKKLRKASPGRYLRLSNPTLAVTASAHGLLDEPFKLTPLLLDRYQPPGPSVHERMRVEKLLASRFLPGLSLNFRQELFWRTAPIATALPQFVIEQELEVLPRPSTTTRIGQSFKLFGSHHPLNVEISARKLLGRRSEPFPSLGLAVHQRVGPGTAFLLAEADDWKLRPSKECQEMPKFSKALGGLAPLINTLRTPPTVEIGYVFGRNDMGMQSGQALTKPTIKGLTALDNDLDEQQPSSWSISTGLSPSTAVGYLRYGRDLFTSPADAAKPSPSQANNNKTGFRAEAELAATSQHDFFLAFRALKRVGRFSKAGLEVGLSTSNLHVSLYWSRLGQRLSLPILTTADTSATTSAAADGGRPTLPINHLLLTTLLLPLTAFSAWEAYSNLRRKTQSAAALKARRAQQLAAHVAARRAEADKLTVVLAAGVGPRQAAARKRGGLVIVSAKFGVRGAPPRRGRRCDDCAGGLGDRGG
ncbi:hypothetical protein CHGG_00864 [Chaetomium globosum CBS 148.51]|uniref:J domain-containing protein n=1 Tax=Chaetomium globosum (strain ATCC 6205 / CBS 148.51 / DSM 1962 / NBRC 6347 / NRRL 1970) TaxID=306901 RepID=Q2HFZ0_CHAGB|nr:uncharacterized protein CHGG_00864 [Chaetomium globosum CBS 148.51]EAQ92629.1 hypothetical protein CHGG_00864 [Chaetomium globosum CBS 148.51]